MKWRTLTLTSTAALTTLVLTACGQTTSPSGGMPGMDHGSNSPTPSSSAAFNGADRMFVTMMIPHHQQAIEMSDLILAKNDIDTRVSRLAQQIKDAQGPEIDTMQQWLRQWGVPTMAASPGGMDGMDHGGGMMSAEDLAALKAATGTSAARLFLDGMIKHHNGAIAMAQTEVNDGRYPDAVELARSVIKGQSAEVETMQRILTSL